MNPEFIQHRQELVEKSHVYSRTFPCLIFRTVPWAHIFDSMSIQELESAIALLKQVDLYVEHSGTLDAVSSFYSTFEGENVLKKAIQAAVAFPGEDRIDLLAKILNRVWFQLTSIVPSNGVEMISFFQELTNLEINVLKSAYNLYEHKDRFDETSDRIISMPAVLEWNDLLAHFPHVSNQEMLSIFLRIARAGLFIRQQGFIGDGGDHFTISAPLKSCFDMLGI